MHQYIYSVIRSWMHLHAVDDLRRRTSHILTTICVAVISLVWELSKGPRFFRFRVFRVTAMLAITDVAVSSPRLYLLVSAVGYFRDMSQQNSRWLRIFMMPMAIVSLRSGSGVSADNVINVIVITPWTWVRVWRTGVVIRAIIPVYNNVSLIINIDGKCPYFYVLDQIAWSVLEHHVVPDVAQRDDLMEEKLSQAMEKRYCVESAAATHALFNTNLCALTAITHTEAFVNISPTR